MARSFAPRRRPESAVLLHFADAFKSWQAIDSSQDSRFVRHTFSSRHALAEHWRTEAGAPDGLCFARAAASAPRRRAGPRSAPTCGTVQARVHRGPASNPPIIDALAERSRPRFDRLDFASRPVRNTTKEGDGYREAGVRDTSPRWLRRRVAASSPCSQFQELCS